MHSGKQDGESAPAVVFRRRRSAPFLTFGIVSAIALTTAAAEAGARPGGAALLGLALLALAAGIVARRRWWTEDQLITETMIVLSRPDGSGAEVPLSRIVRATALRSTLRFERDDGAVLDFNGLASARRALAVVESLAPAVACSVRSDLACPT